LPSFIIGALLVPAFSWYQAVSINFFGNLAVGVLIVVGGYFGTRTGLLCGVAGTLVAVMGLVNFVEQWLRLLSSLYSPLIGVMLVDFFVIKRWSKGVSINIEALAAVGAGVLFAYIAPARYIVSVVGLAAGATAYIILVSITRFVHRKRENMLETSS